MQKLTDLNGDTWLIESQFVGIPKRVIFNRQLENIQFPPFFSVESGDYKVEANGQRLCRRNSNGDWLAIDIRLWAPIKEEWNLKETARITELFSTIPDNAVYVEFTIGNKPYSLWAIP